MVAYNFKQFKPLLSSDFDLDIVEQELAKLDFNAGIVISPKIDGIRCCVHPDVGALSRSNKPIPNEYIRKTISHLTFFDGELTLGNATTKFQDTTSAVMSRAGKPDFQYHVFDYFGFGEYSFMHRYDTLKRIVDKLQNARVEQELSRLPIQIVPQYHCPDVDTILKYEEQFLAEGYEGAIIRRCNAPYKYGRSTPKQQIMAKLKRFQDDEALVVGYEQLYRNQNEAFTNELGYTKRSSHQENMAAQEMVGKLIVRGITGIFTDVTFSIGSGLDDSTRFKLWQLRDKLVESSNLSVKYKHQVHGSKVKPRTPIFLGFRSPLDMGE